MAFLSPLFWLAALAVAGPILLHLVQKERKERILFASLMLMPRIPVKQMRRRRLKHLLLLALRCLGVLLLVAAFARPVATGGLFDHLNPLTARSVVILLDDSMSMSRPEVWRRAVEAAEKKIASLGEADEGKLVLFGEAGRVVSQWEHGPVTLQEVLRTIAPSHESTSYLQGLRLASDQFEGNRNAGREIYLITDLQRSGLGATEGWKVPTGISVEIEDVGEETSNLYVDEARIERDVFGKSYPRPILVRLAESPPTKQSGSAQLFIEGKLVDRQSFEIGEQGSAQVTFKPFDLQEGVSRGRIVVEPTDSMPQDNIFNFVTGRSQPQEVVIVSSREASAFYLKQALSAGDNLPFVVRLSNSLPAQLSPLETPLVVLNDLDQLRSLPALTTYVEQGGGLILAMGSRFRKEALSEDWNQFLPARVVDKEFVRSSGKAFTSITRVSWEHPVFNVFQDSQKSAIASAQFYGYWRLQPNPSATILARFDEGAPALLERQLGAGRVLVFASSLDSVWTDFPLRSAFLPFWYRLAQYAAHWEPRSAALRVNQSIRPSASEEAARGWDVLDPNGKHVIGLEQRDPGALQLTIPGHYEIRENKGTNWAAVNASPLESDMERIPAGDIEAVFVPGESRADTTAGSATIASRERQQSLWWLLLLAAGVVLSVESVVANRTRLRE